MNKPFPWVMLSLLLFSVPLVSAQENNTGARNIEYEKAGRGTRILSTGSGTEILMLLEESTLGSNELEVGEIRFPANSGSAVRGHRHGSIEIFYVIEGVLEHIVNDVSYFLEPGMIGIVRPEDTVAHRVPGDDPVRAVIIWVPGGEADRLGFSERPVD